MTTTKRRLATAGAGLAFVAIIATDPVAAQPGGGQFDSAMSTLIPWVVQWLLVIGALVGGIAHVYAGWTSDPDKAFRRKEWRNRAWFGVALLIPALIGINWVITTFGGDPLDFFPFV
jgi:hypothetical protein